MLAAQEEALPRDQLEALQRRRLAELWEVVLAGNDFYQDKFAGVSFDPLRDRIEQLPFTTRAELQADQAAHPPYGRNLSFPLDHYSRMHQTSGSTGAVPLRWLDTAESWAWWRTCWRTVYAAANVTAADRIVFPFSFGPFAGFWSAFEAGTEQGSLCLPAGGLSTVARVHYLLDHGVTIVCCTPTYALRLAEVAEAESCDLPASPVRGLIVAGEPGGNIPAVRQRIEQAWGARVYDHAGMTEIGAWGFEPHEAPGGMHVIETQFIAEVLGEHDQPVAPGEQGELVLTNLGRHGSPLIRYRTGDLVQRGGHEHVAGRWFERFEGGVLGRVDDMLIIRGNNVFPAAIEDLVRSEPEVAEFRYQLLDQQAMTALKLIIEPTAGSNTAELATRLAQRMQARFHFRPEIELVAPGSLERFELKARRRLPEAGN